MTIVLDESRVFEGKIEEFLNSACWSSYPNVYHLDLLEKVLTVAFCHTS